MIRPNRDRLAGGHRHDVARPATPGPDAPGSRCARCGRPDHLIRDDGPVRCRVCLIAWSSLAGAISSGEVVGEADRVELAHREHRVPHLACPWCRAGSGSGRLFAGPPPPSR